MAQQLNLDQKEAKVIVCMLVEPLDGLTMLVSLVGNDPNDHLGTLASGIGNDLAQVVVICVLELVLDDDLAPRANLLRVDVNVEGPNGRLCLNELQLNAHGRAQHVEVILLGEPLGEVQRLMRPDLAQFDRLELIEVVLLHGAPSEKRRETLSG